MLGAVQPLQINLTDPGLHYFQIMLKHIRIEMHDIELLSNSFWLIAGAD